MYFIRYNKPIKTNNTFFTEGGTDHRNENELSNNLRKRGTDHQKQKINSPQSITEVQEENDKCIKFSNMYESFTDVKTEVGFLK